MNIYEKPMISVEYLESKNNIAADEGAYLAEIDPLTGGNEVSIVAPDDWLEF